MEEQFYLCWPPLLALLTRRPRQYRRLVLSAIVVLGVVGFVLAAWLTPRAPSWAFFLLPTRMGELLAGALLAVLGTQVPGDPGAVRAGDGVGRARRHRLACFRFDEAMPWPGTAVLVPVLATMAVIVGGAVAGVAWAPDAGARPPRCCSGSVATPTPCTCGTGRCSCSPTAAAGPLRVAPGRRGHRHLASAWRRCRCGFVEDPVRHARWLAAVPARSLALGAAMVLVVLAAGVGPGPLDPAARR